MTRRSRQLGVTTLEDISTLILQSHDLGETLGNIVTLVARRMGSEVCSLYLLDEDQETLRLRASKGLSQRAVGKITLRIGEGLTGIAAEERRVVAIQEPQNHPRYRYFKETGEERYHSFLGIPLFDRNEPLGVIVIQTKDPREFTTEEISALSTIAFQISSIVINARLLDSIRRKEEEASRIVKAMEEVRQASKATPTVAAPTEQEATLRGLCAYSGLASGPAHVMDERLGFADILDEGGSDPSLELQQLESALEKTRIQTLYLEKQVAERLSADDAAIFHTHLMILEDRSFIDKLRREIEGGKNASFALKTVVGEYVAVFAAMEDPYLRERAADMEDIGRRLLANLSGHDQHIHLKHPGILVARELLPSDMATLDLEQVRGIVTEIGEMNSHAVIMAKSLGIPALVGVAGAARQIRPDDPLILDANSGCLYVNPPRHIVEEYRRIESESSRELHQLEEYRHRPAISRDGVTVTLRANIGLVSDVGIALRNGAAGVGLYRTEFPYMARGSFPGRHEQYLLYRRVVEGFSGHPVTIRTLDIGGDKALPYFAPPKEDNPFMGWRSVRVSLDNRDIFRTQLEAILMAADHGPVKLLFPMISGIDEVRACKAVVEEARAALLAEGREVSNDIAFGIMIEVPAAVLMIDELCREVDFFALGTNDLVQYMLAADRNNQLVKKYYDPFHPAVLHALQRVSASAARHGKGLCICGELATDPAGFLFLLGIGIREYSMAAPYIPRIKSLLAHLDSNVAIRTAQRVLRLGESARIREQLQRTVQRLGLHI